MDGAVMMTIEDIDDGQYLLVDEWLEEIMGESFEDYGGVAVAAARTDNRNHVVEDDGAVVVPMADDDQYLLHHEDELFMGLGIIEPGIAGTNDVDEPMLDDLDMDQLMALIASEDQVLTTPIYDQPEFFVIPKPASEAAVEALEKLTYDVQVHGSNLQCTVCLENMVSGDQLTRMQCSHMFHGECIVQWLKQSHTCPLCRFSLPGRFLLAAVSGEVLARSFYSVLRLHVSCEVIEQALGTRECIPECEPEMTSRSMEFSVMSEHVQAHVARTRVDAGARLQWLPKIRRGSSKVKRTDALLERVFMPCDMYFRHTRHKGGTPKPFLRRRPRKSRRPRPEMEPGPQNEVA